MHVVLPLKVQTHILCISSKLALFAQTQNTQRPTFNHGPRSRPKSHRRWQLETHSPRSSTRMESTLSNLDKLNPKEAYTKKKPPQKVKHSPPKKERRRAITDVAKPGPAKPRQSQSRLRNPPSLTKPAPSLRIYPAARNTSTQRRALPASSAQPSSGVIPTRKKSASHHHKERKKRS